MLRNFAFIACTGLDGLALWISAARVALEHVIPYLWRRPKGTQVASFVAALVYERARPAGTDVLEVVGMLLHHASWLCLVPPSPG